MRITLQDIKDRLKYFNSFIEKNNLKVRLEQRYNYHALDLTNRDFRVILSTFPALKAGKEVNSMKKKQIIKRLIELLNSVPNPEECKICGEVYYPKKNKPHACQTEKFKNYIRPFI